MVWNAQAKTYFRSKGQPSFLYQGTIQKHIIGGPYGASLPFPQVLVKGYGRSIVPSRNKSVLLRDNLRLWNNSSSSILWIPQVQCMDTRTGCANLLVHDKSRRCRKAAISGKCYWTNELHLQPHVGVVALLKRTNSDRKSRADLRPLSVHQPKILRSNWSETVGEVNTVVARKRRKWKYYTM